MKEVITSLHDVVVDLLASCPESESFLEEIMNQLKQRRPKYFNDL